MKKLEIITIPDQRLYQVSKPILFFDNEIKKLSYSMLDIMYKHNGIGLAAIQVAIPQRIIVINLQESENDRHFIMINPIITAFSDEKTDLEEGCLSVPDQRIHITRPSQINVTYFDENGKKHRIKADNLFAKCIQHEIDHLNGITILDKTNN
jgi:peptide deformylase